MRCYCTQATYFFIGYESSTIPIILQTFSFFITDALHPTPHPSPMVTPSPQGEGIYKHNVDKTRGAAKLPSLGFFKRIYYYEKLI